MPPLQLDTFPPLRIPFLPITLNTQLVQTFLRWVSLWDFAQMQKCKCHAHTLLKTAALSCKFTKLGNLNACSDRWLKTVVLSAAPTVLVRKKASVSTVSLQLDKGQALICLTWPLSKELKASKLFHCINAIYSVQCRPQALDVIAKDTPILYRWPLGRIVNKVAAITSFVWIILFFKTKQLQFL